MRSIEAAFLQTEEMKLSDSVLKVSMPGEEGTKGVVILQKGPGKLLEIAPHPDMPGNALLSDQAPVKSQ